LCLLYEIAPKTSASEPQNINTKVPGSRSSTLSGLRDRPGKAAINNAPADAWPRSRRKAARNDPSGGSTRV